MKFDSNYTKKGGFYIDRENTVNVEYMENLDRYEYFEHPTLDAKFLRIPFKVIILNKQYSTIFFYFWFVISG